MCKNLCAVRANFGTLKGRMNSQWFPFGPPGDCCLSCLHFVGNLKALVVKEKDGKIYIRVFPSRSKGEEIIRDYYTYQYWMIIQIIHVSCGGQEIQLFKCNGVVLDLLDIRTCWCHFTLPQPILRYRWRWSPWWISFRFSKILWLWLCLNELMY